MDEQTQRELASLFMPPGHYYSPIPGPEEIARYWRFRHEALPRAISGIDLNLSAQHQHLSEMCREYATLPAFPANCEVPWKYGYINDEWPYQDAIALRHFLLTARPRRLIEVGSGHSSACSLDIAGRYDLDTRFTFIDPNPERLLGCITGADLDRCTILRQPVQDVPLDLFTELETGDILFIDSSHVAKLFSDVLYYMFEILPRIRAGVFIHIHDIGYPFEYPGNFVDQGRSWNEAYFLRAYLTDNANYEILAWIAYHTMVLWEAVAAMPLCVQYPGGGFWMRKR